ncbi:hypothetical protein PFRI_37230 [Planktotalea frisia]|uniref:Uncharacterized protein n=1 Tax=Planktotalea frisia TaxID=696762 RepID=A0A1L9NS38_9RHOB|nr:hypothetical protein PFRI_37230 [Planktotalea frisia]
MVRVWVCGLKFEMPDVVVKRMQKTVGEVVQTL